MIAANVAEIRARIAAVATRAGRDPAGITLIAVSKTFPAAAVAAALAAGVRDIGENRVQEGEAKRAEVEAMTGGAGRPVWHLIGHLQTNKVRPALQSFDMIHSIDSIRLAEAINRSAAAPVDVLIEVNAGGEASKFGFIPDEVSQAITQLSRFEHLRLRGLMTVAPAVDDPELVRPVFRRLRALRDAAGLVELSMGMSHDYEVAIEEGATMVRVGRAIFGERVMRHA
jgi:pyridoxal phosphate enzyme (YggS family)